MNNASIRSDMGLDPLVRIGRGCLTRLAEAFCDGCYYGFHGILIDLDHLPWYLWQMFPGVYGSLAHFRPRFAHKTVYHGLLIVLGLLVTYVSGRIVMINVQLRRKSWQ